MTANGLRQPGVLMVHRISPLEKTFLPGGGVDEAERACAAANEDVLGFIRPPDRVHVEGLSRRTVERPGRRGVELVEFDSPLPSGITANDRVRFRLLRPVRPGPHRRVVVFHHALYQKWWPLWEWFLSDLVERTPVAMMASPYHFERVPAGEYPGESVCNPNPFKLFEGVRQWTWDQRAVHAVLEQQFDLEPAAVVGFSFGAFQMLLAASAGILDLPIVSIASTNRYAYFDFQLTRAMEPSFETSQADLVVVRVRPDAPALRELGVTHAVIATRRGTGIRTPPGLEHVASVDSFHVFRVVPPER